MELMFVPDRESVVTNVRKQLKTRKGMWGVKFCIAKDGDSNEGELTAILSTENAIQHFELPLYMEPFRARFDAILHILSEKFKKHYSVKHFSKASRNSL